MRMALLLWGCCFALSAQALELKGCDEFAGTTDIPTNSVLGARELQALEREVRKQTEIAWPALLGLMRICGFGVAKDTALGVQILQSSSREGEPSSTLILAGFYAGFFGGPADTAKAIEWMQIGANAGKAETQFMLGQIYARGSLIPKNPVLAERWFLKSASQGNADAQEALGYMYFNTGKYREALPWLQLAAAQGKKQANNTLTELLKIVEAGYLPSPKNAKSPEPEELYAPHQFQSDPKTESRLRANLLDGKPESKLALAAFLQLTALEQPMSVGSMGGPEGTPAYKVAKDAVQRRMIERNQEAVELLHKAAQQGNALAAFKLGTANWYGSLGISDEREGLRLIRAAAAGGEPDAVYWLARAYQQGTGLPMSFVAAYALYFHFEKLRSQGTLQLAEFVPPSDVVLKEQDLRQAMQLALALGSPDQFLSALDNAIAGEKR